MPHLAFDLNFTPAAEDKRRFSSEVVRLFAEVMDTGTDHVAVTLRCLGPEDLTLGRAGEGRVVLLAADLRRGRTADQLRRFVLGCVGEAERTLGVAREAFYAVLTEHGGEEFHLSDRVLPAWTPGEEGPA
jgi:hypothetical protein